MANKIIVYFEEYYNLRPTEHFRVQASECGLVHLIFQRCSSEGLFITILHISSCMEIQKFLDKFSKAKILIILKTLLTKQKQQVQGY